MKFENKILKIINEELKGIETEINTHALQRLEGRLNLMGANGDITPREEETIRKNLKNVVDYNFDPNKTYGIFLGSFIPNPKSHLYTNTNAFDPGIPFYQIFSNDGIFANDSTGDEMWGIIRNNTIKTVMLRKRLQRRSANKPRMEDGGLGVDIVIPDFNNFVQRQNDAKKQQEPKKQQEKLINIDGVFWKIDNANQRIFKKNNPNTFINFNDVLDYPKWDDNIKTQILNLLG